MKPTHCGRIDMAVDRRDFLRKSAFGFGAAALGVGAVGAQANSKRWGAGLV